MEEMINEEKVEMLDNASAEELANAIVNILEDRKAKDVKLIKVGDKTIIADYFVICTGNSNTQIKGIAGEIEYKLGLAGVKPLRIDGYETGKWVVMDYANVIVHIFYGEDREFYKIEKLWGESKVPQSEENE